MDFCQPLHPMILPALLYSTANDPSLWREFILQARDKKAIANAVKEMSIEQLQKAVKIWPVDWLCSNPMLRSQVIDFWVKAMAERFVGVVGEMRGTHRRVAFKVISAEQKSDVKDLMIEGNCAQAAKVLCDWLSTDGAFALEVLSIDSLSQKYGAEVMTALTTPETRHLLFSIIKLFSQKKASHALIVHAMVRNYEVVKAVQELAQEENNSELLYALIVECEQQQLLSNESVCGSLVFFLLQREEGRQTPVERLLGQLRHPRLRYYVGYYSLCAPSSLLRTGLLVGCLNDWSIEEFSQWIVWACQPRKGMTHIYTQLQYLLKQGIGRDDKRFQAALAALNNLGEAPQSVMTLIQHLT